MRIINGFTFYDFCQPCQKITKHRIAADNSSVLGVCESCQLQRPLTELVEVFYKETDLWVTRFKISNMSNVVAGKLLVAIHT
jgi:hypothetical protein